MQHLKTLNAILTFSLVCSLILASKISIANPSGTIYIRPDGTVDPQGAPIRQNGTIYTFVNDIFDSIVVEKSGITIDGKGFKLQGTGGGIGLNLSSSIGVTVQNMRIIQFGIGIYAPSATSITVTNNTIQGLSYFNGYGVSLNGTGSNLIIGNYITETHYGVFIYGPGNDNKILNNTFITNEYSILLGSQCNNNAIYNNFFTNNTDGVHLDDSQDNLIEDNRMVGNTGRGIYMHIGNGYNTICNNTITNNGDGIFTDLLYPKGNNTIIGNLINSNWRTGVRLDASQNNKIYHNSFINNTQQAVVFSSSINFWDNSVEGNYWSNYTGVDSNNDGIGDSPYIINTNNQDQYPLMKPYIPGDANHDGEVNEIDANMVIIAWLSREGELNYNPHVDFDMNKIVNIVDATLIGFNWLRKWKNQTL
jgi:parallel beta-helix repeat protein